MSQCAYVCSVCIFVLGAVELGVVLCRVFYIYETNLNNDHIFFIKLWLFSRVGDFVTLKITNFASC